MSKEGFIIPSEITSFGGYGFNVLESGDSVLSTDRFAILQADGDTVFAFENEVRSGIKTSSSFTLKDGASLYGNFHALVVASGKLTVYYTL